MSESTTVSILIPIYNYNVYQLVKTLSDQARNLSIQFEILCYDDASSIATFKKNNQVIEELPGVIYQELKKNIGRSKIRNKLAQDSKYNHLLLIDCDSKIVSDNYLKNYLDASKTNLVIIGGTVYPDKHDHACTLRLKYGKEREQKTAVQRMQFPHRNLNLNNIFIDKNIYLQNLLDEKISTYGHEDTKFGYSLKEKNIPVLHIDNPVEHCGLESNAVFISKTKEGIKNFYRITKEGFGTDTKLFKTFQFIQKYKIKFLFNSYYYIMKKNIEKNLLSTNPSLFYFDLFKLKTLLDQK